MIHPVPERVIMRSLDAESGALDAAAVDAPPSRIVLPGARCKREWNVCADARWEWQTALGLSRCPRDATIELYLL